MTPPTNPPTPRIPDNMLIAALLAIHEWSDEHSWFEHWQKHVGNMANADHGGDCTGHAASCPKCIYDEQHARLPEIRKVLDDLFAASYARLLAIEAAYETLKEAARNAMDNSWHIDTPHPDCVCADWRGCTVFDDKDAEELWEALKDV